jgi:hypothetical protein
MIEREFENDFVEGLGRDAGFDMFDHEIERLGREPSDLAHGFEVFRPMQLDLAGFAGGHVLCVYESHSVPFRPCRSSSILAEFKDISRPRKGDMLAKPGPVMLEHVPLGWKHPSDENMLHLMSLARFLIARMIPCERKAR